MCLAQRHNAVMPKRRETATPRFRVKHSTTEPLCSLFIDQSSAELSYFKMMIRAVLRENLSLGFVTWSCSNQPAQLHRLAIILKFCVWQV